MTSRAQASPTAPTCTYLARLRVGLTARAHRPGGDRSRGKCGIIKHLYTATIRATERVCRGRRRRTLLITLTFPTHSLTPHCRPHVEADADRGRRARRSG